MNRWEELNITTFRDYRRDELLHASKQAHLVNTTRQNEATRPFRWPALVKFIVGLSTMSSRRGEQLHHKAA